MNFKLIEFHDHVTKGEFSAGTVLFTDLDRGRRLVATIAAGAPFEAARYPAGEAFDVERSGQGHDPGRCGARESRVTLCAAATVTPREFGDIRIHYCHFIDLPDFRQRFNIAPGQDASVIVPYGTGNLLKMTNHRLLSSADCQSRETPVLCRSAI